jgi:ribonuclease P protein component
VVVPLLLLAEPKAVLVSQSDSNQSFPARCRIKQRRDFEQALRSEYLINKWFALHLGKTVNNYARLGMVVGKRTMPRAVARNFAKRLIRECFRQNLAQLPSQDFVVRIRRNLTRENSLEARSALIALLLAAKA